jgi:hypothetical protein
VTDVGRLGREVLVAPASVPPRRLRPPGVAARLHSRRGDQHQTGRMGQNINIQGGQLK